MDKNNEEIKLDVKDRKIIKALFSNGRATYSDIAKQVRLSKEVVNYRIRQLIDSGLITEFNTVIDVKKLGWQIYMVYIRLRNIDIEKERKIIEELENHPNIAWLIKCVGNYDIITKFFVKDNGHISSLMKEIEEKLKGSLEEYQVDFLLEESAVAQSFVYTSEATKETYFSRSNEEQYSLGKIDLKILKLLEHNSRISLAEISAKIKEQRDTIKYHLKKLEKAKVILKYRPSFWPDKLGYNWYFIILKMGNLNSQMQNHLVNYIISQPNVTYFYRTAGTSDMQIEVRVKTSQELNKILMQIRGILKDSLKRHEILVILAESKYTYFPDCMTKSL